MAAVAYAAFFYPAWWLAMFLLHAAPALLSTWVSGQRLVMFYCTPTLVAAMSAPVSDYMPGSLALQPPARTAAIVVSTALAALWLLRRYQPLAGLFIACLGQVAAVMPLMKWISFRQPGAAVKGEAVFYVTVLVFGLWWMLAGGASRSYGERLVCGILAFALPLGILLAVGDARRGMWGTIVAFPAIATAAVPREWPRGFAAPMLHPARALAAGAVLSLLTLGAAQAGNRALRNAERAARAATMAAVPMTAAATPYPKVFFQKGVNFTAEGPAGYAPEGAVRLLDQLSAHGVNAVALVPYGFASKHEPTIHYDLGAERADLVESVAALAHQRGLKVMLKPQLWSRGGFPGEIRFTLPEDRGRWFAQYRRFLEFYARLAARTHADIFCVGVELVEMSRYEDQWRILIARARQLYAGPLVYAATQGDEFERIGFWDALDYIGLNNYYPLPDDLSTDSVVHKVEAVQKRFQRPVIFPEAGFASVQAPNREPWSDAPRDVSPADQARCYEALLRAFYHRPWFQGVYWWKVGTNGYGGPRDGSHTPWGKPAMDVVARWYKDGGR